MFVYREHTIKVAEKGGYYVAETPNGIKATESTTPVKGSTLQKIRWRIDILAGKRVDAKSERIDRARREAARRSVIELG